MDQALALTLRGWPPVSIGKTLPEQKKRELISTSDLVLWVHTESFAQNYFWKWPKHWTLKDMQFWQSLQPITYLLQHKKQTNFSSLNCFASFDTQGNLRGAVLVMWNKFWAEIPVWSPSAWHGANYKSTQNYMLLYLSDFKWGKQTISQIEIMSHSWRLINCLK